jgi:proteasome lid subunit RPN8/RPN11
VRLRRAHLDEIIAHAREGIPHEVCGFVAGKDGVSTAVFRARNIAAEPRRRFVPDAADFLRADEEIAAHGWEYLAVYHSHPASPAYPSDYDVEHRPYLLPEARAIICSMMDPDRPDVRVYRFEDDRVVPEPLEIVEE